MSKNVLKYKTHWCIFPAGRSSKDWPVLVNASWQKLEDTHLMANGLIMIAISLSWGRKSSAKLWLMRPLPHFPLKNWGEPLRRMELKKNVPGQSLPANLVLDGPLRRGIRLKDVMPVTLKYQLKMWKDSQNSEHLGYLAHKAITNTPLSLVSFNKRHADCITS